LAFWLTGNKEKVFPQIFLKKLNLKSLGVLNSNQPVKMPITKNIKIEFY
jgi:hypothetical protein